MAGTYVEGQSKVLSGVYSILTTIQQTVIGAQTGIVAYPFTADWGPVNELVSFERADLFENTYNAVNDTLTAKKVHNLAFAGNPFRVLGYRLATSAAAKATATLPDGWTLETVYPTARNFTLVVKLGVAAGATAVQLLEEGVQRFVVEDSTVEGLTAKINGSGYVRVTAAGDELPAVAAGVNMTGGNNGATVTNAEYTEFLSVLESDGSASALALDGVTDEALLTVATTWLRRVRSQGFYLDFYRGGASSWDSDISLSLSVAKDANYRAIHVIGDGVDGYTSAEMAIFQAAYEAGRGLATSVTDEPIPFTAVNNKKLLTIANRERAKLGGVILYVQVGNEVQVDEGVNTLTNPTGDERAEYGKSRVSRTIDYILRSTEAFGLAYKRNRSNTPEARAAYAATIEEQFFSELVRQQIIRPIYSYIEDPDYHGENPTKPAKLDEAFFYSEFWPVDSMEKIYQKFATRF